LKGKMKCPHGYRMFGWKNCEELNPDGVCKVNEEKRVYSKKEG